MFSWNFLANILAIFLVVNFRSVFSVPVITNDALIREWGVKVNESSDLANKTLQLKKLALEIQELRGVNATRRNDTRLKAQALWDDIQMTEELYQNLKATFEEEKEKILANKTGDTVRATAPDFALIPFAKWSQMPIKYSSALVKNPKLKEMIKTALDEIQSKCSCISFEEVTAKPDGPFIVYVERQSLGPGVCANSPLGKQSDGNVINVASTCQVYGTIIHETLHSLGFAHTQQRPDIEQYLKITWSNIPREAQPNFKPWKYAMKNQGDMDFDSIMMYPRDAFAIDDNRDTLTPKNDPERNGAKMGQRERLSDEDTNLLNKVYCRPRMPLSAAESAVEPECKDSLVVGCGYFKFRGYCTSQSTFASYVQDNCAKTCKLC